MVATSTTPLEVLDLGVKHHVLLVTIHKTNTPDFDRRASDYDHMAAMSSSLLIPNLICYGEKYVKAPRFQHCSFTLWLITCRMNCFWNGGSMAWAIVWLGGKLNVTQVGKAMNMTLDMTSCLQMKWKYINIYSFVYICIILYTYTHTYIHMYMYIYIYIFT